LAGKKSPTSWRPLTAPAPFKFQNTRIHKSSVENRGEGERNQSSGTFKAMPMPDFKSSQESKKLKCPSSRPLTTPEPFKFQNTGSKRTHEKGKCEKESAKFKARPMPKFASKNTTPLTGTHPKSPKELTKTEPFHFQTRDQAKSSRILEGARENIGTKSSRSKTIPTGASGLLFRRSIGTSSRLSQPKVVPEPKPPESKPFKARPMPKFIPDVIVTTTPRSEHKRQASHDPMAEEDEKNDPAFHVRPMLKLDKVSIPAKEKSPSKPLSPPLKNKEIGNNTMSSSFKGNSVPKSLEKEPSIPVRRRDPNKLLSPDSGKRSMSFVATPENLPKSPVLHALPVSASINEPPILVRQCDPDHSPVASPQLNRSAVSGMEEAKARLRERFSKRRSNVAQTLKDSGSSAKPSSAPPKAFSSIQVQSRLNVQAEKNAKLEEKLRKITQKKRAEASSIINVDDSTSTPVKSNSTIPNSVNLPLNSTTSKENRELVVGKETDIEEAGEDTITPQISNSSRKATISTASLHKLRRGEDPPKEKRENKKDATTSGHNNSRSSPVDDVEKKAASEREAKLALTLGISERDDSSSILQLAQEVQRAAEDELSFYGSLDTRNRLERELGF